MKIGPTHKIPFKRRLKGSTNYKRRLGLLLSGKPRLVIRKSLKYITLQLIEYDPKGDKTIVSSSSRELKNLGWNYSTSNIPAAYLSGLILGSKAKEKKIKEAILDIGPLSSVKGSKIYAAVKGVIDAGIEVPCSEDMFPSESRIKGEDIVKYSKDCSKKNQFTKNKPSNMVDDFEKIKKKILKD